MPEKFFEENRPRASLPEELAAARERMLRRQRATVSELRKRLEGVLGDDEVSGVVVEKPL